MKPKLSEVTDWGALLLKANWSIRNLAQLCGVSTRTLERHFLATFGVPPAVWADRHRHAQALAILRGGLSVKATAFSIGYKHATNFTRKFKSHYGCSPEEYRNRGFEAEKRCPVTG